MHYPPTGSDIHIMLALRCSSRQIVVAYEELDDTAMVREFLGKRQRLTHQTGNALAQRVIAPLDVIRFAQFIAVCRRSKLVDMGTS